MSLNKQPLVSIIIPVYNAEKHLSETLQSALNQTWTNKEIIIVDDGSTDGSVEVIKSYDNPAIKLIQQKNQGASSAKQTGLGYANGDFIQYLDADDILHPDKLTLQMKALVNRSNFISVSGTAHFYNDIKDNIIQDDAFFQEYLDSPPHFLIKLYGGYDMIGGMIQPNAFLTPKKLIDEAGPWDASLSPCADEDGEYFCRVILRSAGLIYQPDVLNYYRKTDNFGSLSGVKTELSYLNLTESLIKKHKLLLASVAAKEDIALVHNATFRCLNEVLLAVYYQYPAIRKKIMIYQSSLSPALKPVSYKMGGAVINMISDIAGWKAARFLQHYNPFK